MSATATKDDTPKSLKPYLFHGVDMSYDEVQAQADCPFCGKERKMGIKVETGEFRCVKCETSGNIYSFLKLLLTQGAEATKDADLEALGADRKLSVTVLKVAGIVRSIITGEWLAPQYNNDKSLANVCRIVEKTEGGKTKYTIMATTGLKVWPFLTQLLDNAQTTRYAAEGLWDSLSLLDTLTDYRFAAGKYVKTSNLEAAMVAKIGVIGLPGAGNFQEQWAPFFAGCHAILLGDNDHPKKLDNGELRLVGGKPIIPGYQGQQHTIKVLSNVAERPKSIKQIVWGENGYNLDLPDGFDFRDAKAKENGNVLAYLSPFFVKATMKRTSKRAAKVEEEAKPRVQPIPRSTFAELCNDYSTRLHFAQEMQDTLAVMLSSIISTTLHGDQLWFRIIGPPGCGKSTLAEAVSAAREHVWPRSVVTGFHSGYSEHSKDEEDHSLIPKIKDMTVVMKDADTLIQSANRDRIMSELRDIYDGATRATYRTGAKGNKEYEGIRTTFILCGTEELRSLNRTFLGERFLDCGILGSDHDVNPFLDSALANTYAKVTGSINPAKERELEVNDQKTIHLQAVTYGYILHLKDNLNRFTPPTMSVGVGEQIKAMGQFISYMRAKVHREGTDIFYRPRIELATRLVSQLCKLSICVAIVLGKTDIDDEVMRIVRKVVHDTCIGFQHEVTELLIKYQDGLSVKQIEGELNLPETTIRKLMADMREFKMIIKNTRRNNSGQRGRDVHLWKLAPNIIQLHGVAFNKHPAEATEPIPASAPISRTKQLLAGIQAKLPPKVKMVTHKVKNTIMGPVAKGKAVAAKLAKKVTKKSAPKPVRRK